MRIVIFAPLALFASAGTAMAQTQDTIDFNGTVGDSCTVVTQSSGTLAIDSTGAILASTESGGAAGTADVTATSGSFNVEVDAPTSFTSGPADADTNTTFAASYGASGATTASGVTAGTATTLTAGITTVSVDASATKSSGIFSAGSYVLTTTVRCVAS